MVDNTLIQSVKAGKDAAFKSMYESCVPYVYSIVIRYVSNESDHKDVIQEIFARVFLSINTFNSELGDFKPWLRRLVVNQCIMHYRKKKPQSKVISLENALEIEGEIENKLNEISKEEMEMLLAEMPEGYRQIFMMIIIDEYTHKEVSKLLDISMSTSRSQLSRAKLWIKKNIFNNRNKILANGF